MKRTLPALLAAALAGALLGAPAGAQVLPPPPPSLKTVPVPEPSNLARFVRNRPAAIALGKALFWDMQVGSDGIQACASCHFHSGADNRSKNEVNPGGDNAFQLVPGPNSTVAGANFPFHRLADRDDRLSSILADSSDVMGSQG